jgi:hypothetical protein
LIGIAGPTVDAKQGHSLSMSVDDFGALTAVDQRLLLAAAFERRLEHAKNLFYESTTRIRNHEYRDGAVGKAVEPGRSDRFRHWTLGRSYRMEYDRFEEWSDGEPGLFASSHFNASDGTVRGVARIPNRNRVYGRIGVDRDPPTEANRFDYWLDGEHNGMAEYLFRYLVDHREEYTVEVPFEVDKIRLTVPWQPRSSNKPLGTREFVLDPLKGFLPVRGFARREEKLRTGIVRWRTEEFIVEESRLVGDVWMPSKLKELIGGSVLGPNVVNVYNTEIHRIEAGTVKPEDLEIHFPVGTEVIDAIKGLHYFTDASGNPSGPVEKEVGGVFLNEIPVPVMKPPFPYGRWLFIAGAVVVVGGLAMHLVRRSRG